MLDLLAATAALIALVAVLAVVGLGLTVAPFVAAASAAETRGSSPSRAGLVTLLLVGAGLVLALLVYRSDLPTRLTVVPVLLCWLGPVLARLLPPDGGPLTGRKGLHER